MKKLKSLIPAFLWYTLIWTISSIPAKDIPSVNLICFDKLAHIGIYAVLGLLVIRGLKGYRLDWTAMLLIYALLVLLASADEFHQTYIPGRSVSPYDQLANVLGLTLGMLAGKLKR